MTDHPADAQVPAEKASASVTDANVASRAELLPEEIAVGSEDPQAQAAAILLESEERTNDPDAGI